MAFGSKQKKERLLVISFSRVLIAVCVALSFLATLVPAGFSSPPPKMDCCVGHEAGSCSSGLLASTNVAQPDAFGHHQDEPRTTVFEVSAGVHAQPAETPAPSQAKESKPSRVDNESRACTGECGVCSTSLNRRPRPREHSTLATKARLQLQTSSQTSYAENLHVNSRHAVASARAATIPQPKHTRLNTEASW